MKLIELDITYKSKYECLEEVLGLVQFKMEEEGLDVFTLQELTSCMNGLIETYQEQYKSEINKTSN